MAEIKKDFIAWHKENSHSSQHANFISDDTYTLDHLRVTMENNRKEIDKYKINEEVKSTRQRERRNVRVLIRAHYNSFMFFCLLDSYSNMDYNKVTSVPDLTGPETIYRL